MPLVVAVVGTVTKLELVATFMSVLMKLVRGGLQAVSEEKALQKLYQTLNE
jgi:hypothetical protein